MRNSWRITGYSETEIWPPKIKSFWKAWTDNFDTAGSTTSGNRVVARFWNVLLVAVIYCWLARITLANVLWTCTISNQVNSRF